MSSTQHMIKYVKYNKVRFKAGKIEESTKVLLELFKGVEGMGKGMKGFMVMNNIQNSQESVVLTFWETKEDMDAFYHPNNKALYDLVLVEKLKPSFEQLPERKDYQVSKVEG